MGYRIDLDKMERELMKGGVLQHNSGQRIKILPFKTDYKDKVYTFEAILGELARLSMRKAPSQGIELEAVLDKVREQVETQEPEALLRFIRHLYFKEDGSIEPFHPKVLAYTQLTERAESDQKSVAQFIYDVLICGGSEEAFQTLYLTESDLVVQLLTKALPTLKEYTPNSDKYCIHEPVVTEVFGKDLKILLSNEKLFIKWFKPFVAYYYFFYTSQTILKLNQRIHAKEEIIPMYYLVGDEKGGAERASSKQGFKLLKIANANTFANVMLCQFLNYAKDDTQVYTFMEWKERYAQDATKEENQETAQEIKKFIEFYKEKLEKIPWDGLENKVSKGDNPLEEAIEEAFAHIKYQFEKGGRKTAADKYEKWFYKFAAEHYTKSGGKLGLLLTIQDDLLLFMMGLTLQGKEKERLNIVFEGLQKRGLFFDRYSEEYIVNLLETRNLLEKKSDSGDAKYVRSIL